LKNGIKSKTETKKKFETAIQNRNFLIPVVEIESKIEKNKNRCTNLKPIFFQSVLSPRLYVKIYKELRYGIISKNIISLDQKDNIVLIKIQLIKYTKIRLD